MKKIALMLLGIALFGVLVVEAQVKSITGTVTSSDDGTGIPGVSVSVKGTTIGTVTNLDGVYQMEVPADAEVLVFSFVGMKTQEVEISGSTVDAVMQADLVGLDEVMVVAYGTATKKSFTGSATQVDGEKLQRKNTSEITKALAGEVAGVQVINTSGQPGTNATIRIRGFGSVNASRAPLYIVDGIPFSGDISGIDPSDIESTTVLKDASATAIYGARGANGVVLLTTKKGVKGESKIEVDLKYGMNMQFLPFYETIDSPERFAEITWESLYNLYTAEGAEDPAAAASAALFSGDGIAEGYNMWNVPGDQVINSNGQFSGAARRYTPESWEDNMFSNGVKKEVLVKMSGGADKTSYYTSFGYLGDEGYYIGSDFSRFSVRANVDHNVKDWLKGNLNIAYSHMEQDSPGQGTNMNNGFAYVLNMPSIYPVFARDENGDKIPDEKVGGYKYDYGFTQGGERGYGANINPAGAVQLDRDNTLSNQVTANTSLAATFLKDFKLTTNFGVQYLNTYNSSLTNPYYGDAEGLGRVYKTNHNYLAYTWNQLLSYTKSFGSHNIDAFVAHEVNMWEDRYMYGNKSNIARPDNLEFDNAVILDALSSYTNDWSIESFFGQVKYDFDEKYFVHATVRRDGTSRFPNDKWGTFGSVGLAWMMTREDFMAGVNWLNDMKLKVSYGVLGNQSLGGYYPTYDLYDINNLDDEISISFDYKGNPDLTWESSKTFNVGTEFNILDIFEAEVEYFVKNTDNLLFYKQVAPSLGYAELPVNDGKLQNKGLEFNVVAHAVNTNDFKLDFNINGANYSNEITEMPLDETTGEPKPLEIQGAYAWSEGHSIYDFYIREFAGVDPETGVSLWNAYYVENGGEKEYISSLSQYMYENPGADVQVETTDDYNTATNKYVGKSVIPTLSGGLGIDMDYKGIEFSAQFAYSFGGHSYDNVYAQLMGNNIPGENNWSVDIENRWQEPGDITDVPRLNADLDKRVTSTSTRFLVSNSYLNLTNVRLGYNFPSRLIEKVKLQRLNLYVAGDNLWIKSKRKGYFPMTSESGSSSRSRYAPLSSLTFGLKVEF